MCIVSGKWDKTRVGILGCSNSETTQINSWYCHVLSQFQCC
jgi:hypothetical protein